MDAEVPGYELRSELDRKALETLSWLTLSVERGKISKEQFSTALDALFMTLAGLVDKEFMNIITEAQKMCEED
jgi:hypothetical protein